MTRGDEDAAVERDDAVVVPDAGQPPGLVHHDRPRTEVAVELAPVGDLRKEPEQVASLRAADAEAQERPLACGREIDGPREPRQIPRRRVLAEPERRLALDPDRNRRSRRRRPARRVAAVHQRVVQPERPHGLVHPCRPGRGRSREPDLERVRRLVVGEDQHVAEQARQLRPLGGLAVERAHHGDRDRELERRGRGEARPRVPRGAAAGAQVLHVDAGRPAVTRHERADRPGERRIEPRRALRAGRSGAGARRRAPRCSSSGDSGRPQRSREPRPRPSAWGR